MRFLISILALFLFAFGVDSSTNQIDVANEIVKARTIFDSRFLSSVDSFAKQSNVIVSTYAIHSALSSVLVGAKAKTHQELWNALGYNLTKLDERTFLEANKQTITNLTQLQNSGLLFSNLLAVQDNMPLRKEFYDTLVNDFNATIQKEDFIHSAAEATEHINNWVKHATKNKIDKLFDETLSDNTRAVIANAIHFKSSWLNSFNEHQSFVNKFHLANKNTKNVTYMTIPAHRLKKSRYSRNIGFTNVQIPFTEDDRLYFGIILPDYVSDSLVCCTPFTHFVHKAYETPVKLTLPKFSITQTHKTLKDILKGLGVNDLFDERNADLSGINNEHDLFVSNIVQKATITIDEKGAEAAAATGVVIETKSLHLDPPNTMEILVNHPFIFTITDRASNVDLFTGFVYDP